MHCGGLRKSMTGKRKYRNPEQWIWNSTCMHSHALMHPRMGMCMHCILRKSIETECVNNEYGTPHMHNTTQHTYTFTCSHIHDCGRGKISLNLLICVPPSCEEMGLGSIHMQAMTRRKHHTNDWPNHVNVQHCFWFVGSYWRLLDINITPKCICTHIHVYVDITDQIMYYMCSCG